MKGLDTLPALVLAASAFSANAVGYGDEALSFTCKLFQRTDRIYIVKGDTTKQTESSRDSGNTYSLAWVTAPTGRGHSIRANINLDQGSLEVVRLLDRRAGDPVIPPETVFKARSFEFNELGITFEDRGVLTQFNCKIQVQ